jgi:hypothetical protein
MDKTTHRTAIHAADGEHDAFTKCFVDSFVFAKRAKQWKAATSAPHDGNGFLNRKTSRLHGFSFEYKKSVPNYGTLVLLNSMNLR